MEVEVSGKNAAQCEQLPEISGAATSPKETARAALRPACQGNALMTPSPPPYHLILLLLALQRPVELKTNPETAARLWDVERELQTHLTADRHEFLRNGKSC